MSKIKLAGKSISEILKRIKRAKRNKKATQNQEKAGLSVKSVKPFNYRARARNEQIVPVKKQSQKGSSFQPHSVRGKQGAASIKETSEGSAASWRDEMDKYFGDLRPSKFFKKASGGDINTGMKKLSEKQKKIARMAPPPDQITGSDFKAMKARTGKAIKADPTKPISSVAPKVTDALKKKKLPGRIGTALGIGSMLVPAAYAAAKQYKDYKSAKNRDKAKVKKYSKGMSKEDITQEGKKGIAAGKAVGESLRDKNAPMKRQRLADRQPVKKKNILDKFTDKLNKAGEAYKKLGGAGLNVLKGNTKGQPFPAKKMVGGMAKKYNKGGGADTGTIGTLRSMKIKDKFPFKDFGKKEDRLTRRDLELAKAATSSTSNKRKKYAIAQAMKDSDRLTNRDVRNASSAIKGYKSGTMVKARGCKLGRTRPTKIT